MKTLITLSTLLVCNLHADIITGLRAHYSFDNPAALGTDDSGNGNDGTVNGGAASAVDAQRGNVLSLTGGVDGNIEVALGTIPGSGFTISSWVRSDSWSSNRGVFQVQNGSLPILTTSKSIGGWVNASGQPWGRVIQSGGTERSLPQTGPALTTGAGASWHHLAYRGNGSEYEVFIDGSNVGTASITYDGSILTHSHLFIGRQANESWNGQLDDFRVYDRALSDLDIQELAIMIPEPNSAGLLLLGIGLLAGAARKRPSG